MRTMELTLNINQKIILKNTYKKMTVDFKNQNYKK
jgi:hypothetical protein